MRADVNLDHREASGAWVPAEAVMFGFQVVAPPTPSHGVRDGLALLQLGECVRHRPSSPISLSNR
jgi:hypothetical protein